MGWLFSRSTQRAPMNTAANAINERTMARLGRGGANVSRDRAMRQSATWACLRLRADLVSTMPVDVYRRVGGVQFEVPTPPVLQQPGGSSCEIEEWLYSTQWDLDSMGNTVGIIKARDGLGFPSIIELQPITDVTVRLRKGELQYRIGSDTFDAGEIWHEKQFTTSGVPVGLSPIAYAASSLSGYLSAQQFAADWFSGPGVPAVHLKNSARTLDFEEADRMKRRYKASTSTGDVFVSGNDWDFNMLQAKASEMAFLDERRFGLQDTCRFLGVPGDMIDVAQDGSTIKYANITQRNLQFLVTNLGPSVTRREKALTKLTPAPRFVKLNTGALLRMDLKSRYDSYKVAIDSRWLDPNEVRELEDLAPLTPEQIELFKTLYPKSAPASSAPADDANPDGSAAA
jgi:HK97 family phage portal protein